MRFDEMPKQRHREIARLGGLAPKPKPPRREYCNRRHRLEGDNVRIVYRHCWNKDRTKQYDYTTYVCRQCAVETNRKIKWRRRTEAAADKMEAISQAMANKTHCPQGHELTPNNLKLYKHPRKQANGTMAIGYDRVCLQCARERYRLKRYGNRHEPDHRLLSKEERDASKGR